MAHQSWTSHDVPQPGDDLPGPDAGCGISLQSFCPAAPAGPLWQQPGSLVLRWEDKSLRDPYSPPLSKPGPLEYSLPPWAWDAGGSCVPSERASWKMPFTPPPSLPAPEACGRSPSRDRTHATAVTTLAGSLTHRTPTPAEVSQPSSSIQVRFRLIAICRWVRNTFVYGLSEGSTRRKHPEGEHFVHVLLALWFPDGRRPFRRTPEKCH